MIDSSLSAQCCLSMSLNPNQGCHLVQFPVARGVAVLYAYEAVLRGQRLATGTKLAQNFREK